MDLGWTDGEHHQQPHTTSELESDLAQFCLSLQRQANRSDLIAVGNELGVRAVLTGRIMQRGETMLISTELIDVRDNKQLWGEQYEKQLADMLSVQREIAREITNNLRPTLSGMEQLRADKQYTANSEAYQ